MRSKLVRMLSTGRSGTRFMASVFADQGYLSFHEDLYVGEPFVAVKHYLNWLGDLWKNHRSTYYIVESKFTHPYREAVQKALERTRENQTNRGPLARLFKGGPAEFDKYHRDVVVHSGHLLTVAAPFVQLDLESYGIDVHSLVLLRNPLKTIHAIFRIEGQSNDWRRSYRIRPESFYDRQDFLAAAQIWANTYRLINDQMERQQANDFQVVWLDRFSNDIAYTRNIFGNMELAFNAERFVVFTRNVLNQPLRASKVASVRNSDLYIQPDFSFDERQIEAIGNEVDDVVQMFSINWDQIVEEYLQFHAEEKERLGFSGSTDK